jgi:hypothetical protein
MSTSVRFLYKPVKISDIENLGFIFHQETEETSDYICIKADKIWDWVVFDNQYCGQDNIFSPDDYIQLGLDGVCDHKGHKVAYGFTRYGANSAAYHYLLNTLDQKGQKLSVEGQRVN